MKTRQHLSYNELILTANGMYADYNPIVKDITKADFSRLWRFAKKTCRSSENEFKNMLDYPGIKKLILSPNGQIRAILISYFTKNKEIYISYAYHDGSIEGSMAFGYLCITTFLAFPTSQIYFHSDDNNAFKNHSVWVEDKKAYRLTLMDKAV